MVAATLLYKSWERFVVDGEEVSPDDVRPCILKSWKRCRSVGVDPYRSSEWVTVTTDELARRRAQHADLLETAVPYVHELYRIIQGSRSVINLTDEDGVVLELVSDPEILRMKNFPQQGSVHSEGVNGTNGIGTSLAVNAPIQIHAEEHWLKNHHAWSCNGAPIHRNGRTIGCLNLSCPFEKTHEHSLGLIVASVNAIEREMELKATLGERQFLIQQQNAVLELLDTGIVLIDAHGVVVRTNRIARDILRAGTDMVGRPVAEMIPANLDFLSLVTGETSMIDQEKVVRLDGKPVSLSFSTALVRNGTTVEGVVIRVRESTAIIRMVHRMTGSRALYSFEDILGRSPELLKCIELGRMASSNNLNTLILGESGTGKELFAHAIHNASARRNGPFVAINCGALSRDLIQSELFGYEGGAFTGAKKEGNPGKLELADGGTLFLDEIGELPLDAQVNLLRVLETGEVTRLGGKYAKSIDVRVISATNKDIYRAIVEKTFRDDLFYRINTFVLKLPALRERPDDIRMLARTLLERSSRSMNKAFIGIEDGVLEIFEAYPWPGNIRELANTLDRAIAVAAGPWIKVSDLPPAFQALKPDAGGSRRAPGEPGQVAPAGREAPDAEVEQDRLAALLDETNGNLREVARRLGVARSTVYNKVKRFQIPIHHYRR